MIRFYFVIKRKYNLNHVSLRIDRELPSIQQPPFQTHQILSDSKQPMISNELISGWIQSPSAIQSALDKLQIRPYKLGMKNHPPDLIRGLKLGSAFCVVSGGVIGTGIFLVAADIAKSVPNFGLATLIWIVAGLFSLLGALIFAELGAAFPQAGGQYVYFREAFGLRTAFVFSWTHCLILAPGTLAALAVGFARFFSGIQPLMELQIKILAISAISFFTFINLLGVKRGAAALEVMTWVKILALVGLGLGGLFFSSAPAEGVALPEPGPMGWSACGVAMIAAFWAYDGWNGLSQVAGEIENPVKNIPRASAFGILAAILLYLWVNTAISHVLSQSSIAASSFVAADAAALIWGAGGRYAVSILVIISALGCLNGSVLTGARVTYATAQDGAFPKAFGYLHSRYRVPSIALMLQFLLSLVLIVSGNYDQLFTYVVCAGFTFYALTAVALIKLRNRKKYEKMGTYRVPFFPLLPILYILGIGGFLINAFLERPWEALIGFGIVLAGIPAYSVFKTDWAMLRFTKKRTVLSG